MLYMYNMLTHSYKSTCLSNSAETLCQPVTFYFFFRLLGAFETLGTLMSQGDQNVARSEEAKVIMLQSEV